MLRRALCPRRMHDAERLSVCEVLPRWILRGRAAATWIASATATAGASTARASDGAIARSSSVDERARSALANRLLVFLRNASVRRLQEIVGELGGARRLLP